MDGHLEDDAAAAKPAFNYVFVCEGEDHEHDHYIEDIEELNMIKKVEVILSKGDYQD